MSLSADVAWALGRARLALGAAGEERPEQEEMAAAVCEAVEGGGALMVRAGTGVGKSLAYLLPVLLSGRRAVVATATHALQDQIARKDLPLAAAAAGQGPCWAVLRGRQSYLCRLALEEARRRPPAGREEEIAAIAAWAARSGSGEREDLSPPPSGEAWAAVSVSGQECPGPAECERGGDCFAARALAEARRARVVLTTSRMYATHMASGCRVLPPHDIVVVDECHRLEADLEEAFGVRVSPSRARRAAAMALGHLKGLESEARRLEEVASRLEEALERAGEAPWDRFSALGGALGALGAAAGSLALAAAEAEAASPSAPRARRAAAALWVDCDRAIRGEGRAFRYVERGAAGAAVRVAPVGLGAICERGLWARRSVILCSADATVGLARRLGLPEEAFLGLPSPWDWGRRAMLYVPEIPSPKAGEAWERAAEEAIAEAVRAAGGRALVLCTSWRMLERLARRLEAEAAELLVQGRGARGELLRRFREEEASVLVATKSFFAGVDAPGPTLSLVALDRVPFPAPGDPLVAAKRQEAGRGGFAEVDLAEAGVWLNQAAGRLLRRSGDAGVVMVADSRLAEAPWGRRLLGELPPMPLTRDRGVALRFLAAAVAGLL